MLFENQRPGIYSRYEIAGYYGGGKGGAALLLPCPTGEAPGVLRLESYHQGLEAFSGNLLALDCLRLLFGGGAGEVAVILAAGCLPGLEELGLLGGVRAVVSGFTLPDELSALRDFAEKSTREQRECIAFAGLGEPQAAIAAAPLLGSGRVVLCCPTVTLEEDRAHPLYGACALAAAVLGAHSPIHNFNGESFPALREAAILPEDAVQALLKAGVSVFEKIGGGVELIRAVTTEAGNLRSLNTVLIIDNVMSGIRGSLRQKLRPQETPLARLGCCSGHWDAKAPEEAAVFRN